jgi:hypothetical protein
VIHLSPGLPIISAEIDEPNKLARSSSNFTVIFVQSKKFKNFLYFFFSLQLDNFQRQLIIDELAMSAISPYCPVYAPFFGIMGATASCVFTCEWR